MRAAAIFLAVLPAFAVPPQLVTPRRHTRAVMDIQQSMDGKWIASLGMDDTVRIWSLPDLIHLRTFSASAAEAIAVGPSRKLAMGLGYALSVLNVDNGKTLAHYESLPDQTDSLAWSPDGTFPLSAGEKLVRIDASTGGAKVLAQLPHNQAFDVAQRIVFLDHGSRVLVSGRTWILLYRTSDWMQESSVQFPPTRVQGVRFAVAPDESSIAAASEDLILHLYSLPLFNEIASTRVADGVALASLFGVAFSSDGSTVGVNANGVFERFDSRTLRLLGRSTEEGLLLSETLRPAPAVSMTIGGSVNGHLVGLNADLTHAIVSRDANPGSRIHFVTPTAAGLVLGISAAASFRIDGGIWDVGSEVRKLAGLLSSPLAYFAMWKGKPGPWSLIADAGAQELRVRNLKTGSEEQAGHFGWPQAASRDGKFAIGPDADGKSLTVVDVLTGKTKKLSDLGLAPQFVISPGGEAVALSTEDGRLRIWRGPERTESAEPAAPPKPQNYIGPASATALAFSNNGQLLAAALADRTVRVWNVAANREIAQFAIGDHPTALSFSPDDRRLAVTTPGRLLLQLDLGANREIWRSGELETPANFVSYLSPNRIVTGSEDGLVSVFDVARKQRLGIFFLQSPSAGPWLAASQSGFFDASEATYDELLWRFSPSTFDTASVSRYFSDFFLPGVFARIWNGTAPQPAATLEKLERATARVAIAEPVPSDAPTHDSSSREVELELTVSGPHSQNLRLFRNNRLVREWSGTAPPSTRVRAKIQAGENEFTAYAFNDQHVRTESARLSIQGAGSLMRPGTLYILAVGVDEYGAPAFRLDYAKKDASSVAAMIQSGRASLAELVTQLEAAKDPEDLRLRRWKPSSGPVVVSILLDRDATKQAILGAIRDIAKKSLPEDSFLFYFAGHGLEAAPRYFLAPSGLPPTDLTGNLTAAKPRMISDLDLESALEEMDVASGALIIDACESGQAVSAATDFRRGPIDAAGLAQLAFEKDLWVLAASQSKGSAFELKQKGHGLLAYALTEDSLGKGKVSGDILDQDISLPAWLEYAASRVPELQTGAISARRGLNYNAQPAMNEVQRPRLLSRQLPGAQPLILAPYSAPDPLLPPLR